MYRTTFKTQLKRSPGEDIVWKSELFKPIKSPTKTAECIFLNIFTLISDNQKGRVVYALPLILYPPITILKILRFPSRRPNFMIS
jgi:hypothetical protein